MSNVIEDWFNNSDSTGIKTISSKGNILKRGIYDLQGRKLQIVPSEGVFIVNGVKVNKILKK